MRTKLISIAALMLGISGTAALAAGDDSPDWIKDTSGVGRDVNGVVRSDQLLELGVASPGGMQLEGENLMKLGNIEEALLSLQKAVEMAPMDMDKRTLYAQALEKKLLKQKDHKDPALYNFLVKQWLYILKHSEFADQTMEARAHLISVCGSIPKPLESSKGFLARVLIPEDGTAALASSKKMPVKAE